MQTTLSALTPNPCFVEPKQVRSRQTHERIVAAAYAMIQKEGYEALLMSDLARRAKVGLGSLYNRFPSKERLLIFLANEIVIGKVREQGRYIAAPNKIKASSLSEFLRIYCTSAVEVFSRYRAILQPMALLSRTSKGNELAEYLASVNEAIHVELANALQKTMKTKDNARTRLRIAFAISWIGSALREQYLFCANPPQLNKLSKKDFVGELVSAISAYLSDIPFDESEKYEN